VLFPAFREVVGRSAYRELGEEFEAREHALLDRAVERLGLSARAYHRVLRVARTIADLAGSVRIGAEHLAESIQYRRFDARA
jgi:magnesium chelatase family protein